jgi:hypothetical protein
MGLFRPGLKPVANDSQTLRLSWVCSKGIAELAGQDC